MAIQDYLEKKLRDLDADRKQTLESLDIVRDKIKGADEKRGSQPNTENYKKWSGILKGLERDLDKHNVHLTAVDAEIDEKKRKLADYRKKAAEADAMRAAMPEKILAMSIEEVGQLTAEEIAMLQEYELSQEALAKAEAAAMEGEDAAAIETAGEATEAPEAKDEPAPAESPAPDVAPASESEPEAPPTAEPPKPQVELTAALKKVAENRASELTLAELGAIVDTYARVAGGSGDDPQRTRMRDLLTLTVRRLEETYGGLRDRWAAAVASASAKTQ
ncbi:MAG: hypothetical protein GY851_13280 [bacterium]|nr:hypothetical protein [bacterium]